MYFKEKQIEELKEIIDVSNVYEEMVESLTEKNLELG